LSCSKLFNYGISAVIASTVLVAGCTTDKGEIKDYNEQVQKAFFLYFLLVFTVDFFH
jgi:hypothetical protein